MAANTAPIFTDLPKLGRAVWLPATTANTDSTGVSTIGTSSLLLLTAGADGTFLNRVRFTPAASAASTATTASIHRLFLSTVSSGATTSANASLIAELSAPAQTADAPTAGIASLDVPLGFYIPTGISLLWTMHHAAAASTAWHGIVIAGDY
jgi:hypothetical protein